MSANVFLASCDSDDFDRTVGSTVDLSEYPDRPEDLADLDSARLWGVPEGSQNRSSFEKMESGDLVLFYQGDDCVGLGRVGTTFEDDDGWVRTTLWSDEPATLVYTLAEFSSVSVPTEVVNRIFGYGENYSPPALMRVADDRVDRRPAVIERAIQKYDERHD